MELKDYRDQLDRIDGQLVSLFKERMETVKSIADYKKEHNTPVLAAGREREILYRVTGLCGEELQEYTKLLYSTLLELSRDYQEDRLNTEESKLCREILAAAEHSGAFPSRAVVACQGMEGAYSQMACDKLFSLPQIMYFNRFDGVFRAVEAGMCRYGILPIENSSAGSVTEVYDLMEKYNCKIVRSLKLKIEHCLLAKPGVKLSDIKEVVAHEQALNQCGEFLKAHGVKITIFSNNAAAAQYVSQSDRTTSPPSPRQAVRTSTACKFSRTGSPTRTTTTPASSAFPKIWKFSRGPTGSPSWPPPATGPGPSTASWPSSPPRA